jgi:hypothetical protein
MGKIDTLTGYQAQKHIEFVAFQHYLVQPSSNHNLPGPVRKLKKPKITCAYEPIFYSLNFIDLFMRYALRNKCTGC